LGSGWGRITIFGPVVGLGAGGCGRVAFLILLSVLAGTGGVTGAVLVLAFLAGVVPFVGLGIAAIGEGGGIGRFAVVRRRIGIAP